MSSPAHDVIVVGGGVVGCAAAYFAAREGLRVLLLERGTLASQASGAAAGMLAPIGEAGEPGPFLRLGRASLGMLPALCERLQVLSGIDSEFEPSGLLRVAFDEDESERLRQAATRLPECRLEWLDSQVVRAAHPGLAAEICGALWSPEEAHVRSPLLARALGAGATALGASLETGVRVRGLQLERGRVGGVRTDAGLRSAGAVVVCTGAFCDELGDWLADETPWRPRVTPVRGQILSLDAPQPPLATIVWGPGAYLVPKRDGSVVVGATEEHVGFDRRVTAEGMRGLLTAAPRLVPALADAGFRSSWAGLRPGSADGLPAVGPVPGVEGLLVALGHHRTGVLLAAITGQLLADRLLGKAPAADEHGQDTQALDPARWLSAAEASP